MCNLSDWCCRNTGHPALSPVSKRSLWCPQSLPQRVRANSPSQLIKGCVSTNNLYKEAAPEHTVMSRADRQPPCQHQQACHAQWEEVIAHFTVDWHFLMGNGAENGMITRKWRNSHYSIWCLDLDCMKIIDKIRCFTRPFGGIHESSNTSQ